MPETSRKAQSSFAIVKMNDASLGRRYARKVTVKILLHFNLHGGEDAR